MRNKLLLIAMTIATVLSLMLAYRNAKPVCMDLVRSGNDLLCVYDLGDVQEDNADVIIVDRSTTYLPLTNTNPYDKINK